jgi:carboxymethylenebutenolidase
LLLLSAAEPDPGLCALADRFGIEGYVTMAVPADVVDAARAALAAHARFCGQMAALGFGAAVPGGFACVVMYDPPSVAADVPGCPVLRHVAGAGEAASVRGVTEYRYPGTVSGFSLPESAAYDKAAAEMAFSRTLGLLRKAIGPEYDLDALWEIHRACEFVTRDPVATMATMVPQPYVNHAPTMTGGYGRADLFRFYRDHFIPKNPKDMRNIPISRTVGANRVVNEGILCFTHDTEIDWLLPGVKPTGRYVEIPLIGIITFQGDKLAHEHIYWDNASLLVQVGLLDPAGLPVGGIDVARKVMDPSRPANHLLPSWQEDRP